MIEHYFTLRNVKPNKYMHDSTYTVLNSEWYWRT